MVGRKRKINALRDASGISREHERRQRLDYEARLARRARDLVADGVHPSAAPDRLSASRCGADFCCAGAPTRAIPAACRSGQYDTAVRLTQSSLRHAGLHGYSLNVRHRRS